MAGNHAPGTPPPEVPEEFAQAYRDAYAAAMAAMPDPSADGASGGAHRGPAELIPRPVAVALLGLAIIFFMFILGRIL